MEQYLASFIVKEKIYPTETLHQVNALMHRILSFILSDFKKNFILVKNTYENVKYMVRPFSYRFIIFLNISFSHQLHNSS